MSTENPPEVSGLPVLGNTLQYLRDPVGLYETCGRRDADVLSVNIAGRNGVVLTHPDHVERVLMTGADEFVKDERQRQLLGRISGRGLATGVGEFWRRQRELVGPAFRRERLSAYTDSMTACTERTLDDWTPGETVVVDEEMRHLTLQVVAESLFGTDVRDDRETIERVGRALADRIAPSSPSMYLPSWVPTPTKVRFDRALSDLDDVIERMIAERRNRTGEYDDLLSRLLEAEADDGHQMSDETLRNEMVTFILSGRETTAFALTATLYLLGGNPEVRSKLCAEIDRVVDDGTPTREDLPDLQYLDRVFTESLRLYPPAYMVRREPVEDVTVGGYELPEGAIVALPQLVVHRDERFYDDPEQFRPDRWTDDFEERLHRGAYFPFGAGRRQCIGETFATLEAKLALATILSQYELVADDGDDLDLSLAITTHPADPVEMTVRER